MRPEESAFSYCNGVPCGLKGVSSVVREHACFSPSGFLLGVKKWRWWATGTRTLSWRSYYCAICIVSKVHPVNIHIHNVSLKDIKLIHFSKWVFQQENNLASSLSSIKLFSVKLWVIIQIPWCISMWNSQKYMWSLFETFEITWKINQWNKPVG